jgi:hypothetical protein
MMLLMLWFASHTTRFEFELIIVRLINERMIKESFPLPRIDDLIDQLREATCITHIGFTIGV